MRDRQTEHGTPHSAASGALRSLPVPLNKESGFALYLTPGVCAIDSAPSHPSPKMLPSCTRPLQELRFLRLFLSGLYYTGGLSSHKTLYIPNFGLEREMLPDIKIRSCLWRSGGIKDTYKPWQGYLKALAPKI